MRLTSLLPRLALAAALLLSCVPTAHVLAQSGPPIPEAERDRQARGRFEQGREAYKDGRYRDAWAYFHQAYQLSGRPELLFNIGQTADRLGQESDALRAFSMYLERVPNAENRRDVENRVRALRERIDGDGSSKPAAAQPAAVAPAQPVSQPTAAAPVRAATAPVRPEPRSRRERRELRVQQQSAVPAPAAAPAAVPAGHAREPRRGLYLRAAVGLGPRADAFTIEDNDTTMYDGSLSGWGPALDLAAGWAVLPGFVVGGGLFLDWASRPSFSADWNGVTYESTFDHLRLTSFGPFVDWYPKRLTLGLHVEGGLGVGALGYVGDVPRQRKDDTALGFTFFLGAGYEWRIAGAFAIGALLRFTGSVLSHDTESHAMFSPSLLVSFTWF